MRASARLGIAATSLAVAHMLVGASNQWGGSLGEQGGGSGPISLAFLGRTARLIQVPDATTKKLAGMPSILCLNWPPPGL